MNVLDVDLLLYAYDEIAKLHTKAKVWLTRQFNDPEPTGLTLSNVLAFVRIATSPRILSAPLPIQSACALVDEWFSLPQVILLLPTDRHWKTAVELAVTWDPTGSLIPDADLAATALEHGAIVCTHDRRLRPLYQSARLLSACCISHQG